ALEGHDGALRGERGELATLAQRELARGREPHGREGERHEDEVTPRARPRAPRTYSREERGQQRAGPDESYEPSRARDEDRRGEPRRERGRDETQVGRAPGARGTRFGARSLRLRHARGPRAGRTVAVRSPRPPEARPRSRTGRARCANRRCA